MGVPAPPLDPPMGHMMRMRSEFDKVHLLIGYNFLGFRDKSVNLSLKIGTKNTIFANTTETFETDIE